jgi:two-component system, sensor histidine kinase PdtaS
MNSPVISGAEFQEVANSAPVILWRVNPEGYCDWFNQALLDFTGRTAEEELGFCWVMLVHPDDEDIALGAFRTALKERRTYEAEYRAKKTDPEGTRFCITFPRQQSSDI